MEKTGAKLEYLVGTMIEFPRAALTADEIAEDAEFFSFGTNDLTQTTIGLSRDDCRPVPGAVPGAGSLPNDPFQTLDQEGVGELIKMAAERGPQDPARHQVGICGEHGGDPASVHFCHGSG